MPIKTCLSKAASEAGHLRIYFKASFKTALISSEDGREFGKFGLPSKASHPPLKVKR